MQFDIENQALKQQIFEILESYQGDTDTYVQYNKKLYTLGRKVSLTTALMSELMVLLGEKNVKVL